MGILGGVGLRDRNRWLKSQVPVVKGRGAVIERAGNGERKIWDIWFGTTGIK